jgi:hypothetical protein
LRQPAPLALARHKLADAVEIEAESN